MVRHYFQELFRAAEVRGVDPILASIEPCISPEENEYLCKEFMGQEIRDVLFQMHPSTAAGPYGISRSFFQNFWNIMGNDVIGFCLNFLNHGIFTSGINDTTIVLIPKVSNPEEVANFRPISLFNVIYKLF